MRRTRRPGAAFVPVFACFTLLLAAYATRAAADGDDASRAASARALFEQGVQSSDQGAWVEAEEQFRAALELRSSAVIRFNLAAALAELRKLVEASELLRAVEIDDTAQAGLRAQAGAKLVQIRSRLATLTVLTRDHDLSTSVLLNERVLTPEQLGVPLVVDPGTHRVRAMRAGAELDSREVSLDEGASAELQLASKPLPSARQTAAALPVGPLEPQRSAPLRSDGQQRSKRTWWAVGGAGAAVVVAATVATVLLVRRKDRKADPYPGDFDPPSVGVRVPQ